MTTAADRLRAAGTVAWALVGMALLAVAVGLLFIVLRPLLLPLLVASFLAIAFMPVVDVLARRGVPRAVAALAALLIVIALAAGASLLVVWGVARQRDDIRASVDAAVTELGGAAEAGQRSASGSADVLLAGVAPALGNLLGTTASVVLGLYIALFACFFLLRDGHAMAARVAGRLPARAGRPLLGETATAIRRYFVGLTVLGVFNAVVVAVGALILGVPLVGTIAVITFLGSYVPYFGAFAAGAFAVLIALGDGGVPAALWMLLVVLLANGLLQNLVSPFAFGAALRISPLLVLLAAVLGGALAGVVGMALATPLTAVALHSIRSLRPSRAQPSP